MCTASGPSEIVFPSNAPRDTSNELIKSNYELSEENKKKNAEIMAARNKAKSLVSFQGNDNENNTGKGVTFAGGIISDATQMSTPSGFNDASGGFTV